jgi:hypothetical protein
MLELKSVRMEFPADANIIVGQSHFIKTVEDLYEAVTTTVPQAKFGLAFNESSGACLTRSEGNDSALRDAAVRNAQALGAGHTFVLLRQSYESALSSAGIQAPQGMSLIKGYLMSCMQRQPACQQGINATNASTVAGARADASGKAQLPAVAAGTYYFFCLGGINKQLFKWDFPVNLKPGANVVTLDQRNATPVN